MTAYPRIGPVPPGMPRPFWSVMIPTFDPNLEHLAQTLTSVLAQDPGGADMEIAVIDDHSCEVDPRGCLSPSLRDRISWFRQEAHVGIAGNWNTCISSARGQWVHILHQDDMVRPGFYARLRDGIGRAPAAGAAFCRDVVIDADGQEELAQVLVRDTPGLIDDWIEHVFVELHMRAPAVVVRRSVYETLGGFSPDLQYALDWDMWKRIASSKYRLWYEPAKLACYRRHSGSASFGFMRSGSNIAEIRRSIELSEPMLDPAIAAEVTRRARATYARYAAQSARRSIKERRIMSGLAQFREARKLS